MFAELKPLSEFWNILIVVALWLVVVLIKQLSIKNQNIFF